MKLNRVKPYWLLLLVLLMTISTVLSTGMAQARYINTVTTVAVIETPVKDITSNCLVTAENPARTVLLGEMDTSKPMTVPFWLLSSSSDATAELKWGVANPDHTEYLSIGVLVGNDLLVPGEEISLMEDIRLDLALYLVPTEIARSTPHDTVKVTIHVTLGEEMWGTFQVILPEVEKMEEIPETEEKPTDGTEPVDATEPTESMESTDATESSEETGSDDSVEPTTSDEQREPADPAEPKNFADSADDTEPADPAEPSDPAEPADPAEPSDPADPADPAEPADPANPEDPVEPEESTEPEENPYAEEEECIELKTLATFNANEQLPVVLELADHITSVRFGVQYGEEEDAILGALPNYTMFSVDGGNSYYMVYGDYVPEFVLQDLITVPILMDFRYAKLEGELNLAMEAYMGEDLRKTCVVTTQPNVEQIWQTVPLPQKQEDTAELLSDPEQEKLLGPVLTFENMLEFIFPLDWEDAELEYTVEILTVTEDQTLAYVPVNLSEEGLQATYCEDEDIHRLVFQLGHKFAQPGTYRITMTWTYEGICYDESQTTFFINCSARKTPADERSGGTK